MVLNVGMIGGLGHEPNFRNDAKLSLENIKIKAEIKRQFIFLMQDKNVVSKIKFKKRVKKN